MHGFVDTGAVRGAEHRSRHRISPQGRGDGSPRWRSSTRMYCLSHPVMARSAGHPAALTRGGAPRPALDLFGYFLGQCQKVTRSRAARVEALHLRKKKRAKAAGMTNEESKKASEARVRARAAPRPTWPTPS